MMAAMKKAPHKTFSAGIGRVLKRQHYPLDVILLRARWYVADSPSLRNLKEMMAEWGIEETAPKRGRNRVTASMADRKLLVGQWTPTLPNRLPFSSCESVCAVLVVLYGLTSRGWRRAQDA
jgi:hypothetical protein